MSTPLGSPGSAAPARFAAWRESVTAARVVIVGDVMLDRYWFGEVERISPGRSSTRASVTGDDEPGAALARLVRSAGVQTLFHRDAGLNTTVKLRVIGRQQQLLRIDFETSPSSEALETKLAEFDRLIVDTPLVILSDYGKGGLAHIETMIARARQRGSRVLVDPKGDEWDRYRGANVLTPNRNELRAVIGRWRSEGDLTQRAQALRRKLDLEALLVTRSEEGMTLYTDAGALTIPAQAREVYDVSGAGDTVIATLGTLLAANAPLTDAVHIANQAAGIVVGKLGTAVVTPAELQ